MSDEPAAKVVKSSNRGSAPGERRGGRVKGVPNKATASLKDSARVYTLEALETLVAVMRDGESDKAKVAAANAILDRGYGKASTVIAGDEDGNPATFVHEIILKGVRPNGSG